VRVAIGQIRQETNTFNAIPCELKDFQLGGIYFGTEILDRFNHIGELGGFFTAASKEGDNVELLPILRAAAMSGGRITNEALEFFKEKLVNGLKEVMPLDGVFLSLHGGAASEKVDDFEGYLLSAVRDVVGDRIPIIISLDHHANITKLIVKSVDALIGYQTQPHDPFETGLTAGKVLFSILKGETVPSIGWKKIPMLAPPDRGSTSEWPMKEWFDLAREMEKRPGIISVSTFPVQPWLDVPELGWAAVVITDNDPDLAHRSALELANKAWKLREEFWHVHRSPLGDLISYAAKAKEGPIIICDVSDSVLSGAPGDSTCILRELLKQKFNCPALLPIVDPEVVDKAIQSGMGSEVTASLGGKRDQFNQPVRITARVAGIEKDGLIITIHTGPFDMGRTVLLEVRSIKIIVSENRGIGGIHPDIYKHFGIDPSDAKIIIVKTYFHYHYFDPILKEVYKVDCPGVSGWDLRKYNWIKAPRPLYPLDELLEWLATG
jgi:microcystin degradation protein MlrC